MQNPIIRPIITERSMTEAQTGRFTFAVARFADKDTIRKAVETTFNVKVVGISTTVVKGKTKRVGQRRNEVVETPWKKAIVQVAAGQKIALFDLAA